MNSKPSQSGFTLLILLIVLMGAGGLALAGFSKKISNEVNKKRFIDNQEVLQQAKQDLLMYAYRYPSISFAAGGVARGPGRLPCPDTDDDGDAENFFNCSNGGPLVGRFPRLETGLSGEDYVDSSGYRLWYAVSHTFSTNKTAPDVVNSDSLGSITVLDTNGNVLHDGSSDAGGVAAIIFAPGPPIRRTDEYQQVRIDETQPDPTNQRINPDNYLDIFFGEDNSDFVFGDRNSANGTADGNGFVLGPVYNPVTNSIVVNDQMILLTTEEVVAMAEKATLEAYRDAINNFLNTAGIGTYPWLYDYATLDLSTFNSGTTNIGRIPSIFSNYFEPVNSEPIDTEILISVAKVFRVKNEVPSQDHPVFLIEATAGTVSNVRFTDTDNGHLLADADALTADNAWYFYKDGGDWKQCDGAGPPVAGGGRLLSDCNQDIGGNNTPGSVTNDSDVEVLKVGINLDFTAGIDFSIDFTDTANFNITHFQTVPSPNHATVRGTFNANIVAELPATVYYQEGDYDTTSTFTVTSSDQQFLTDDGDFGDVENQVSSTVTIDLRYYPELPSWVKTYVGPGNNGNSWHNSIQMAYAPDYAVNVGGLDCTVSGCLTLSDLNITNDDIVSLLVIGGENTVTDINLAGFADDMDQIFDAEQLDPDTVFSGRLDNDSILVIRTQ